MTLTHPDMSGHDEPMSGSACRSDERVPRWLLASLLCAMLGAAGCSVVDAVEPELHAPAECVVFDIDGTLTPKVSAIHTARDGAATAVQTFADAGYEIIYLSARMRLFRGGIPVWLEENGFPSGRLRLTESREDRKDHAAFKARVLDAYHTDGCHFAAAYGDSSSDFAAYAGAGIDPQRVFALKRKGEDSCQAGEWSGCYDTWEEQMGIIREIVQARE